MTNYDKLNSLLIHDLFKFYHYQNFIGKIDLKVTNKLNKYIIPMINFKYGYYGKVAQFNENSNKHFDIINRII